MEQTKTVPVYVGLAHVRRCFRAIECAASGPIMDFVAALRERELVAREVAAADARIQATAAMAGLAPVIKHAKFSEAIEAFRAHGGRRRVTA